MAQNPLAQPPSSGDKGTFDRWVFLLWKRISSAGQVLWSYIDFSGSNITDIATRNHADLQNLNTTDYTHLTAADHTDLTDGGATLLHKHDHSLQDNLNSTSYYHLTSTERTDLLGASYLTLATSTSLTSERTLALGTGLTYADAGAGAAYTISPVAFLGDSGTGGAIGAVPAPAAGDGAVYKYLSADGIWRNPGTSGAIVHNTILGLQGGVATAVFEATAFESTAFQTTGITEYYHVTSAQFDELGRANAISTVSVDTTMTDDYATYIVDTSAVTLTLPTATAARIGLEWTTVMDCTGYVDVAADPTDEIVLPGGNDTIRLDQIGSTLTLRCVTATQWVIT